MKQNKQEQIEKVVYKDSSGNFYIRSEDNVSIRIDENSYNRVINLLSQTRQEAIEEEREYFNNIGIMHNNWIGGLKHAIEAVNLSLVGHGCRFIVDDKENILFYDDADERGNPIDLSKAFGRLITKEMSKSLSSKEK